MGARVSSLRDGFNKVRSTLPRSDVCAIRVIDLIYDVEVRYCTGSTGGLSEGGFTGWGLNKLAVGGF